MQSLAPYTTQIDKDLDALCEDFNKAKKSIPDEKQLKTLEDEFNKAYIFLKLTQFGLEKKIHRCFYILF